MNSALSISQNYASELNELREELLFAIGQVRDFSVSNQVYVFNEEDLKQVLLLKDDGDESTPLSIEEIKQASEDGQKLVAEVQSIAERIKKVLN